MKKAKKTVKASELIEAIRQKKLVFSVCGDEDCYPRLRDADIDVDSDDTCRITAYYEYPEDQPAYGVSPGYVEGEILGVCFHADRDFEGEHDEFEISGIPIEYDQGLTQDDIVEALEEDGDIPAYDPDDYEFDECSVSDDDIREAVRDGDGPSVFATDGSDVYGYDDEESVPSDYEIIDRDEAVDKLLENGAVDYCMAG